MYPLPLSSTDAAQATQPNDGRGRKGELAAPLDFTECEEGEEPHDGGEALGRVRWMMLTLRLSLLLFFFSFLFKPTGSDRYLSFVVVIASLFLPNNSSKSSRATSL
jgi:hypothetical protein